MLRNPWTATTRTRGGVAARDADALLEPGEIVQSPNNGMRYRIEQAIGAGGFGQAYLAHRVGRSSIIPSTVCIKVSTRMDGWVRETYFGQVLGGHERAIRVFDAFPLLHADARMKYVLVLELAEHGDLSAFLRRGARGWSESLVRREIAGLLDVLRRLHRGQALHRDLTPVNVFVCEGPRLKLGDFGIVRHQNDSGGITAHTMNRMTAPSEFLDRVAPKWQARDDVYQVGQLLGMLILGDASRRIRTSDVRSLKCSDHLKEIVHRCIGERRKRYESADELIEALRTPPTRLKSGALRTLAGAHVAFTGILTKTRKEAARAAKRAGAIVHDGQSSSTTVLVRGRPNPLQAAGKNAGLKLMEIKRLRTKGHKITLLNEQRFWALVGVNRDRRDAKPRRSRS